MLREDQSSGYGKIFRLITPILILILGWMIQSFYNGMDRRFEKWDTKMDSFILENHLIDRRVDKLEYKVFGMVSDTSHENIN